MPPGIVLRYPSNRTTGRITQSMFLRASCVPGVVIGGANHDDDGTFLVLTGYTKLVQMSK